MNEIQLFACCQEIIHKDEGDDHYENSENWKRQTMREYVNFMKEKSWLEESIILYIYIITLRALSPLMWTCQK